MRPLTPPVGFVWTFRILRGHRFHRRRPAFVFERNLNPISGLFIGIPTPLPPDYDYSWNPDRTNGPLRDLCYEVVAWAADEFPTISVQAMDFWSALGGTSAKQRGLARVFPAQRPKIQAWVVW